MKKKKIWKIAEICTNMHFSPKYAQGASNMQKYSKFVNMPRKSKILSIYAIETNMQFA
jgi:hypothetical protein